MKFPYQLFRNSYYPIIPITIIWNNKRVNTSAIVDSGASISIFSSSIGRLIGLDIESGEKRIFQGASAKLAGYIHKVKVIIAGKEIECKIAFSDELSTSFNLVGRETIFDKFIITFNEKYWELSIEPV
ncbi:MAG: aspartyl protease family protein [Nanoarchaeota archaeon]